MKEYWGLTAKVDSVCRTFSGCGEARWPIDYCEFAGYYLNITPSKKTNLALKSNYRVKFQENIGEKAITKTGFWKSNSPDRILVMLTQQGIQKIQEELIFKRLGVTLSSTKLNKTISSLGSLRQRGYSIKCPLKKSAQKTVQTEFNGNSRCNILTPIQKLIKHYKNR